MSHVIARLHRTALLIVACVTALAALPVDVLAEPVTVVHDGKPVLPIIAGSVESPASELRSEVARISGAELAAGKAGDKGVYVGLISDFDKQHLPNLGEIDANALGDEGFVVRSAGGNLYLLAGTPLGVQHAITTYLHKLGRRQFFPGQAWEVVPSLATIEGDYDLQTKPDYRVQRRLWYGFGAYGPSRNDLEQWSLRNRMGGPEPISTGHTWYGLDPEKNFEAHPEWFALVKNKDGSETRKGSKPCYSHPEVIKQIVDFTIKQAEQGAESVSLSAPDGLGYCQCELCRAVFQGAEPYEAHSTLFAERPDGVVVNITSETLFNAVNEAAKALAKEHPDVTIGCYAYSAYSHPPSFNLEPNVYVQTTTAYRRTPLSLQEQLDQWGQKASQVGIREYWSVYQWDWDNPGPGKMTPGRLKEDLAFYHGNNVVAMNGESSNNWGPRGLGYYVAAQLLWDVGADTDPLVRDFYEKAFGPAAPAMERYYARWYGPSAVVGLDPRSSEIAATLPTDEQADDDELTSQAPVYAAKNLESTRRTLAAAFADLDEAVAKTAADSPERARVDQLRMYAYYLYLRLKTWEAADSGEPDAIIQAVKNETVFGGRLTDTNMIHARPLIGKAFHRRFRGQMDVLEKVDDAREWNKGWRVVGEPPSADELQKLWQQANAELAK